MTFVHELGHSAVGLALGMKLRAFVVGPFQWRIESGKWSFQFRPIAILQGGGGATGIVAPVADFPRERFVWMIAAGPLANLVTGVLALWLAFTAPAALPVLIRRPSGALWRIQPLRLRGKPGPVQNQSEILRRRKKLTSFFRAEHGAISHIK